MGTVERWFKLPKVTLHIENDGARALNRGAEPEDVVMTWEDACKRYPVLATDLLLCMSRCLQEHSPHTITGRKNNA